MGMKIIMPGSLTTVQDAGRFGYQSIGITTSGAMDQGAFYLANELAGNTKNAAVLEMTLMGATILFTSKAWIALTGANMEPMVNDRLVSMNAGIQVKEGDTLRLGYAKQGCRCYLAVHGGLDVPEVMKSRSTNLKCRLGGLEGRKLQAGDELSFLQSENQIFEQKAVSYVPPVSSVVLRVQLGPQDEYFTEQGVYDFFHSSYTVSADADRMGYKLKGTAVEAKNGVDIISDGIVFGSVQIPPNGQPIVMMADHQTTGGYAKIAVVVTEDLYKLAQCKPGDMVQFSLFE